MSELVSIDGCGRRRQTHCKNGHLYDEKTSYWKNHKGYMCRSCRECQRLRIAKKREHPDRKKLDAEKSTRWRIANPEKAKAASLAQFLKKKKLIDDARAGGCTRCPEKDLACLDFHHRDGKKNKLGNLGKIRSYSDKRILAEIAKCDVLCANCHRKHHRDEREQQPQAIAA